MTCKEIAARIDAHLKRFEADPEINAIDPRYGTSPFWRAFAQVKQGTRGAGVRIKYVGYQIERTICKADAERYLAWLDAGNVGKHWEALR